MKINVAFFAVAHSEIRRLQWLPSRWKEVVNLTAVIVSVVTGSLFALYAFAAVIVYFIGNRFYPISGFSYLRCINLTGVVPSFLNTVKA